MRALAMMTAAAFVVGADAASAGQTNSIETLVREGDSIPDFGVVDDVDNVAVNDSGEWILELSRQPSGDENTLLLKNGEAFLQEGQPLDEPKDALLDTFDSVTLNNDGDSGWNFFLDNTGSLSNDSGVYLNDILVLQEGTESMAGGLSDETPYIGFFEVKYNNVGQMLVMASVDDPNISSSVDRALMRWDVGSMGSLNSETVLAKESDELDDVSSPVEDFGTDPQEFSFNDSGDAIYIAELDGPSGQDSAVFLSEASGATTLLAMEGMPSGVDDRDWASLSFSAAVGLNGAGDWALRGRLEGDSATETVIVKNGDKLVQEGDSLDSLDGATIVDLGSSPRVMVTEGGDVLWWAAWEDDSGQERTGLFLNEQLLIGQGETMIDGLGVEEVFDGADEFEISPDGGHLLFTAALSDGLDGAFLAELETGPAADLNGDGVVDGADLGLLLGAWGDCPPAGDCPADLNGDGMVDGADLGILLGAWTQG